MKQTVIHDITFQQFKDFLSKVQVGLTESELKGYDEETREEMAQKFQNTVYYSGRKINILPDDEDLILYVLNRELGYFDSVLVTGVNVPLKDSVREDLTEEEVIKQQVDEVATYRSQLKKYGVIFDVVYEGIENDSFVDKHYFMVLDDVIDAEDFVNKVEKYKQDSSLDSMWYPNAVYVHNLTTYKQYLDMLNILRENFANCRVVYEDSEQFEMMLEEMNREKIMKLVQSRDHIVYDLTAVNEKLDDVVNYQKFEALKQLQKEINALEDKLVFVTGETKHIEVYGLFALEYYRNGKQYIFESRLAQGQFMVNLYDFNQKEFMMMEEQIKASNVKGLKVLNNSIGTYLVMVEETVYETSKGITRFQGLPLRQFHEIDFAVTDNFKDLEIKHIDLRWRDLPSISEFGSVMDLFKLDQKKSPEDYYKDLDMLQNLLTLLEELTDIKRALTVRDLIVVKHEGELCLGWMDLKYELHCKYLIDLSTDGVVLHNYVIEQNERGYVQDFDIMVDYKEARGEIYNLAMKKVVADLLNKFFKGVRPSKEQLADAQKQFVNKVSTEFKEVAKMPVNTRTVFNMEGTEVFLIGFGSGVIAIDVDVSNFKKNLYNKAGYVLQNKFFKDYSRYLSLKNTRKSANANTVLDVFGNLNEGNTNSEITLSDKMFKLSDEIISE